MLGGVGMKRGRRDPEDLRAGDVLDCWRVLAYEAPRVLSLEAEMRHLLIFRGMLAAVAERAGASDG